MGRWAAIQIVFANRSLIGQSSGTIISGCSSWRVEKAYEEFDLITACLLNLIY